MPSSDAWFICSCNERLETTDDVDAHDKSWLALGHDLRCRYPGCKTVSPQTSNAKRHWRTHLPERLGKYFCLKCDASYVKPEHLEKHKAAAVCRKNRKRCRSVFEENSAIAVPSINPRKNMSSPNRHATESQPSLEVPSNDTSSPSTTSTPSLDEEAAGSKKAWLVPPQLLQAQRPTNMTENFIPAAILQQQPALGVELDWYWLLQGPPPDDYSDLGDNELGAHPSSDEWRNNTSSLRPIRERSTGLPIMASLGNRGFHHIQRPDDTRANTGTCTCTYHGCTQRFESQPALQRHRCYLHRSQEHNNHDSGAESDAASVSPRPHARPVLKPDHTPVSRSQYSQNYFTIDKSQTRLLLDLKMERARREPLRLRVELFGRWDSGESLLNDFTKNARFSPDRPSLTNLWGAIMKAMTTRPPGMLKEILDLHRVWYVAGRCGSSWALDIEWIEEGIVGHWKCGPDPPRFHPEYNTPRFGPDSNKGGLTVYRNYQ